MKTLTKYLNEKLIINKNYTYESTDFVNSNLLYRMTLIFFDKLDAKIYVDIHENYKSIIKDKTKEDTYIVNAYSVIYGNVSVNRGSYKKEESEMFIYNYVDKGWIHFLIHEKYKEEMIKIITSQIDKINKGDKQISLYEISEIFNFDFSKFLNIHQNLFFEIQMANDKLKEMKKYLENN